MAAASTTVQPTAPPARSMCPGTSKQKGAPCGLGAGHGTDHVGFGYCKFHGGSTANGGKHARKLMAAAIAEQRGTDPHEAIQEELDVESALANIIEDELLALAPDDVLTGAQLHDLVKQRRESGDRRVRIAQVAVDAGVAERRIRLDEQLVGALANAIDSLLTELGVRDHPDAPAATQRALRLVEAA